ncbi:MAG: hypothetical protein ACQEQC_03045 [Elusimicrobiota bacterium]
MTKCKFRADKVNIYGLLMLIYNIRENRMLRYAAVAGCNPEIYETNIQKQWFTFEKELYSRRLKDGSLREITQRIEQAIILKIQEKDPGKFYRLFKENKIEQIQRDFKTQVKDVIKYDTGREVALNIDITGEKLNLRQFRYLTDKDKINDEFKLHLDDQQTYPSLIALDVEFVKDQEEIPKKRLDKVEAGDMLVTRIVDIRDIGIYLSYLLGGRKNDKLAPLSAPAEDVKETDEGIEIVVRYGPGIVGRYLGKPKEKINVVSSLTSPRRWWLLVFPAVVIIGIILYYYLSY